MDSERAYVVIKSIVNRCLSPGFGLDREDLITSLWIELFESTLPGSEQSIKISAQVIKFRCMSALKKLHRRREESLDSIPLNMLDSLIDKRGQLEISEIREYKETVKEKLNLVMAGACLLQDDAELIRLYFYQNWSYSAIASQRGVSAKSLERRMKEALSKIRQNGISKGVCTT